MSVLTSALDVEAEGNMLRLWWDRLSGVPGGRLFFHQVIRLMIPYTGSLGARIEELKPGEATVVLDDRRAVRNHLRCVHAIALANLAELCGNVAVAYSLPDDARFIVAGMKMTYTKKARGRIAATTRVQVPASSERTVLPVIVEMRDAAGELVARGELETLISPKKKKAA